MDETIYHHEIYEGYHFESKVEQNILNICQMALVKCQMHKMILYTLILWEKLIHIDLTGLTLQNL